MANILNSLIPTAYAALNVVSRERTGFLAACTRNSTVERAAQDQPVLVPIVQAGTLGDNTPAATPPDSGDHTVGNVSVTITKSKNYPIRWNGEEQRGLENAGTYDDILLQEFATAFRVLGNTIEADLAAAAYKAASRAVGTAGTAPFGTAGDLSDAATLMQVLEDNGAPPSDLHLVVGSAAMANIRGKQSVLFKVNEAGTDDLLRKGIIGELEGFMLHNSRGVVAHTKGTAAGYLINNGAGYAVGSSTLAVDTGTGTHLAGDVVTIAADASGAKYVINTGGAGDGAKNLVIGTPGLQGAVADNAAMTTGNSYRANVGFHRSALILAARLPVRPKQGDLALDVTTIQDPITGLIYELAIYGEYRRVHLEVALAWGVAGIKPDHIAILMG